MTTLTRGVAFAADTPVSFIVILLNSPTHTRRCCSDIRTTPDGAPFPAFGLSTANNLPPSYPSNNAHPPAPSSFARTPPVAPARHNTPPACGQAHPHRRRQTG